MSVIKAVYNERGRGDNGIWNVCLELPFFGNKVDEFYEKVKAILVSRAMDEGIGIYSYLTVTYCENGVVSLFVDVLFCRGRELIGLKRFSDNRDGEVFLKIPKAGKYECVYRRGDNYFACENSFSVPARKAEYKRFLREVVV